MITKTISILAVVASTYGVASYSQGAVSAQDTELASKHRLIHTETPKSHAPYSELYAGRNGGDGEPFTGRTRGGDGEPFTGRTRGGEGEPIIGK